MSASSPQLDERLRRCIVEKGWSSLSPIQETAFPIIYSGVDCVVEAPTAGGKTEAVLFPLLTKIAPLKREPGVRILYLAPLRALLNNLELRIQEYASVCGLEAFKWHGDVNQAEKLEALQRPPQVLITTPESVEAILLRKASWRAFFAPLTAVVIDEAHSFAFGDRGGHLLSLLERLEDACDESAQRVAVTATIGNPDEMLRWLAGRRTPGRRVKVDGQKPQQDYRLHFFDESKDHADGDPADLAAFRMFSKLVELLPDKKSIVFARSRRSAEALAKAVIENGSKLTRKRLEVRTHHSSVSKFFREEAEHLIQVSSESGINAIISTSTLELGIDIGELDWVVQMDVLSSASAFLQRVGRTGRRAGRPQRFRAFVTKRDDLPVMAAVMSLGVERKSEALRLPRKAYHMVAHQLLCLSLQTHGLDADVAWDLISRVHCFSGIDRKSYDYLVRHMIEQKYLRDVDGVLVVGEETERIFLPANWRRLFAVFDSAPMYEVHEHRGQVGTLDAGFVEGMELPFHFVLGGRLWLAKAIDSDARIVRAERSSAAEAPKWTTFGGPNIPIETAQEAGRLLHGATLPEFLDDEARETFRQLQTIAAEDGWTEQNISVDASAGGQATITTFAGDAINRTLAKFLTASGLGKATASYRSVELKNSPIGGHELKRNILERLRALPSAEELEQLLLQSNSNHLWMFSPYARCLPGELWAAALSERTVDVEGCVRFVGARTIG